LQQIFKAILGITLVRIRFCRPTAVTTVQTWGWRWSKLFCSAL